MSEVSYSHQVADEVRIALVRNRSRFTQAGLAERAGIHPATFSARMRGRYPFTVDEIEAIAAVLDIEPANLMPPRTRRTPAASATLVGAAAG